MARCPHHNVQQYTECCLDCGRNVYETDDEYLSHLRQEAANVQRRLHGDEIEQLELRLGIRHPGNDHLWTPSGSEDCSGPSGCS